MSPALLSRESRVQFHKPASIIRWRDAINSFFLPYRLRRLYNVYIWRSSGAVGSDVVKQSTMKVAFTRGISTGTVQASYWTTNCSSWLALKLLPGALIYGLLGVRHFHKLLRNFCILLQATSEGQSLGQSIKRRLQAEKKRSVLADCTSYNETYHEVLISKNMVKISSQNYNIYNFIFTKLVVQNRKRKEKT